MDNTSLWNSVLAEAELSLSSAQFVTWFKDTHIISNQNGTVVIGVPNGFAKEWLENKFNKIILNSLRNFQSDIKEIKCVINGNIKEKSASVTKTIDGVKNNSYFKTNSASVHFQATYSGNTLLNPKNNLNPRYTFENFIVGENNELARAACYAVSQKPGMVYNPLFIYGGVGLGKTHLLQSIGNEVLRKNPEKVVKYISSEAFTTDLIDSIKNGTIDKFKEHYKKTDLLIIDDIQFISGKEKTQTEFFHIFNALYQINKQVVLSSDRPPKEISILEERLRSRFEGGMIADVSNPDMETRVAILKQKATEKNFSIKKEHLRFLAENFNKNVRELEGALNKLIAYSQLNQRELSLNDIKEILLDLLQQNNSLNLTRQKIIKTVADFYEIQEKDLFNKNRKKKVAFCRQMAMFLIRYHLKLSFPEIGDFLGGRDHTTVMYACKKISSAIYEKKEIESEFKQLNKKLNI